LQKERRKKEGKKTNLKDERSSKTKEFDFSSCGLRREDEINTKKSIKIGTRKLWIITISHKTIKMFNISIKSKFHLLTLFFFTKKFLFL